MMTVLAFWTRRVAWPVLALGALLGGCAALPHGGGTLWTILAVVLFVGIFLAVIGHVRRRHGIVRARRGILGERHDSADTGSSSYLFAILATDGSTSHAAFAGTADADTSGWESRNASDAASCTSDTGSSYSDGGSSSCSSDSGSSSGSDSGGGGGGGGSD